MSEIWICKTCGKKQNEDGRCANISNNQCPPCVNSLDKIITLTEEMVIGLSPDGLTKFYLGEIKPGAVLKQILDDNTKVPRLEAEIETMLTDFKNRLEAVNRIQSRGIYSTLSLAQQTIQKQVIIDVITALEKILEEKS